MTPEERALRTFIRTAFTEPADSVDAERLVDAAIAAAVSEERGECAKVVPTTWLDPLLSGQGAKAPPFNGPDIERLLRSIAAAIRARRGGV